MNPYTSMQTALEAFHNRSIAIQTPEPSYTKRNQCPTGEQWGVERNSAPPVIGRDGRIRPKGGRYPQISAVILERFAY